MTDYSYCILTSGQLFESPYGEEGFALSLGKWLAKQNLNIVVVSHRFLGTKVEYLSKLEKTRDRKINKIKTNRAPAPYILSMLYVLFFSLLCFIKILSINRRTPIRLIHSVGTGYPSLAA